MSPSLLGCCAHHGNFLGQGATFTLPANTPLFQPCDSLLPLNSHGFPRNPSCYTFKHPCRAVHRMGVSAGWGSPTATLPRPTEQVGRWRGAPCPQAPCTPLSFLSGRCTFFVQGGKTPRGCQAAKLSAKNTAPTQFSLGPLKQRKSERILVAMEMTWTKASGEREGENELGRRLESCPQQAEARLSLREVLAIPRGDEQCCWCATQLPLLVL